MVKPLPRRSGGIRHRLEFLAAGMFGRWDKEINALLAAHPDCEILAGLTPANLAEDLFLDTPPFGVVGRVHRMVDNLMSLRWVFLVTPFDSGRDLVAVRRIQGGAGALYEEILIRLEIGDKDLRGI